MKKLLMAFAVLSMGIFASCDKCKDVDCNNGGTCDDGDCTCAAYYSGEKCDTEVRAKYAGDYNGMIDIPSFQSKLPTTIKVTNPGSVASVQGMQLVVVTDSMGSTTTIDLTTNLTSNTAIEVPSTKVPFTLIPGETEAFIAGTGVYSGDSLTANITIQGAVSGFTADAEYKGSK